MGDTSVMKVQSKHSPRGEMGQKHLALGINLAMRLWDKEQAGDGKPPTTTQSPMFAFSFRAPT